MPPVARVPKALPEVPGPVSSLPLIDIGDLSDPDSRASRQIVAAIGDSAQRIGFFRICGYGIDPRLIDATYAMAERFFARPENEKLLRYIGRSSIRRFYVPFTEKGDHADEVQPN